MENLFKNPETSIPAHVRHPLDQFKFTMRKKHIAMQNSGRPQTNINKANKKIAYSTVKSS